MHELKVTGIHAGGDRMSRVTLTARGDRFEVSGIERGVLDGVVPGAGNGSRHEGRRSADAGRGPEVALAAAHVMTRMLTLPPANETATRQMVAHRLEADLPLPVEQLHWGHRRLNTSGGESEVLAQAARRDRVERLLADLAAGGLAPDVLTTEAEALTAFCRHGLQVDTTARLMLIMRESVWLIVGLHDQTVTSVRRLSVDPARIESALAELRQHLQVHARDRAAMLWLGAPEMLSHREELVEALGVEFVSVAACGRFVDANGRALEPSDLVELAPAIGAALAGLRERERMIRLFERPDDARQSGGGRLWARWRQRPLMLAGTAAALLLVAMLVHVLGMRSELGRIESAVRAAAAAPPAETGVPLMEKVAVMRRTNSFRLNMPALLTPMCEALPDQIVLTSVTIGRDGKLTLKGTAKDVNAVYSYADKLRENKRLHDVRPDQAEPRGGGSFTITATVDGIRKMERGDRGGGQWP